MASRARYALHDLDIGFFTSMWIGASLLLLAGCGGCDYDVELPRGYRLIRTNPDTIMIWSPEGPSTREVVPPKIVGLGVRRHVVFGRVEYSPDADPPRIGVPPTDAAGYFILDTNTSEVKLRLDKRTWLDLLSRHGLRNDPLLERPSRHFKYKS